MSGDVQEFLKEECDVGADTFNSSKSPASGPVIICVIKFYFGRSEVTEVGVYSLVSFHGDLLGVRYQSMGNKKNGVRE